MMLLLSCIVLVAALVPTIAEPIEQVDDNDLVHLLTGEDNVIALFTKSNCQECSELESVVASIQKDLEQSLGAVVVKASNSQLVSIYDPSREPALVYFRRGIPLLYYGEHSEDDILRTFNENKDPVVKELSDQNFEHLTQASTGATTGDWFLFFYSADCVFCQRLYAVWEAVGAKLRHRLNVARINRLEAGISTAKRLGVSESPEFIFLNQGKLYRYKLSEFTPKTFIEFAEGGYKKQTRPELVPAVPNLFTKFSIGNFWNVGTNPKLLMFASVGLLSTFLAFYILRRLSKKAPSTSGSTKKSK